MRLWWREIAACLADEPTRFAIRQAPHGSFCVAMKAAEARVSGTELLCIDVQAQTTDRHLACAIGQTAALVSRGAKIGVIGAGPRRVPLLPIRSRVLAVAVRALQIREARA